MSFIKNLYNRIKPGDSSTQRTLSHPRDLTIGDMLSFGFTALEGISQSTFKVIAINRYDFGNSAPNKVTYTLQSTANIYYLSVISHRGEEHIELGQSVLPDTVAQIFDIEQFALLFDDDSGENHTLERIAEPASLSGWTNAHYQQEACHQAYIENIKQLDEAQSDQATAFDYYTLVSNDRQYGLQIEVYDGGRTDVYLLASMPVGKIESLWPGTL